MVALRVVHKALEFPLFVTIAVRDAGERCERAPCSFFGPQSNLGRPLNERECEVMCGS